MFATRSLTLLLMTTCVLGTSSSTFTFQSLGKSSELFASAVYKEICTDNGNLLMSPASLQTLLALIQTGSNGTTLQEMSETLYLPNNKTVLSKAFQDVLPFLRNIKRATLKNVNKVYVKEQFDISPAFAEVAKEAFVTDIEPKNFVEKEKTANDINTWVESQTNNKIKNLVSEDDINVDTQMILINALYFNGEWEYPFDVDNISKRNFYINSTHNAEVDMMVTEQAFKFNEDNELDAKFLEIPYSGDEFTMTLILPNKKDALPKLEAQIDRVLQQQDMSYQEVVVAIPKFKIENNHKMNNILQKLGMIEAFSFKADLSGLSLSNKQLKISKVIQKTYIEVNEKGTEAAAASAGFVVDRIFGGFTFHADHPFIFVLRQTSTGIIQFIGRFSNP